MISAIRVHAANKYKPGDLTGHLEILRDMILVRASRVEAKGASGVSPEKNEKFDPNGRPVIFL